MEPLYAFTFIVIIFAIGNILAYQTRSIVSMLFTSSLVFLILFNIGLPRTLFEDSTLLSLGAMLIPILLVHMGTSMNLRQLAQQWKVVLIAISAIVGIVIMVVGVGQYIVGLEASLVAAPPISGGVIAAIQMGEAVSELGMPELQILASLLVVVQGFFGYPIASYALSREGRDIVNDFRQGTLPALNNNPAPDQAKKRKFTVKEGYKSNEWYLAKAALVASLAVFISASVQELVGFNLLDRNILSLVFGVVAHEINFLESQPLNKGNSIGLSMVALTVVVLSSLASATLDVLIDLLPIIFITLILATIGIIILSAITAKLLKVKFWLGIAVGVSALFGFPGTYIIPNEVAEAVAETPEERQAVLERIQPQMLVAGFITVSIASVVLAGILAPILVNL